MSLKTTPAQRQLLEEIRAAGVLYITRHSRYHRTVVALRDRGLVECVEPDHSRTAQDGYAVLTDLSAGPERAVQPVDVRPTGILLPDSGRQSETREPEDDHTVKHIGSGGYACGGPHYRPPDGSRWAYCEPGGEWFRVSESSELRDGWGNVVDADYVDMTVDGENVILMKSLICTLWSAR